MILLFTAGGRTGNQLFQLAYAISNRREREWIFTSGFGRTRAMLADVRRLRVLNVDCRLFRWLFEKLLYPVLYHGFVATGLASSHFDRGIEFAVRRGRLRRLTVMKGYFESSRRHAANLGSFYRLKGSLQSRVRPIVAARPPGCRCVFVHLRRSDALLLPETDGTTKRALPDWYYTEAVHLLKGLSPNIFFIVVGDDPDHAERLLRDLEPKWVSRLSVEEDLALMSLCDGGVLSNSTLAWWGAFFGGGRVGYVVPKYWFGWKVREWHPPEIQASFMTQLIDISRGASS